MPLTDQLISICILKQLAYMHLMYTWLLLTARYNWLNFRKIDFTTGTQDHPHSVHGTVTPGNVVYSDFSNCNLNLKFPSSSECEGSWVQILLGEYIFFWTSIYHRCNYFSCIFHSLLHRITNVQLSTIDLNSELDIIKQMVVTFVLLI